MPNQFQKANAETTGARVPRLFHPSALVRASAFGVPISALALLLTVGCVSKEAARENSRRAFEAGVQQGRKDAEVRLTSVFIRGPVQQPTIPWRDGLTVAQAIVEAVYNARQDPQAMSITRGNRIIPVDLALLLQGIDPPLEAGDILDIR